MLLGWYSSVEQKEIQTPQAVDCNLQKNEEIQNLYYQNSRLKESYRVIEKKLRVESLCWELWCWTVVWYVWFDGVYSGRIVLYSDEWVKEWEKWQYWVQDESNYQPDDFIWFDSVLPPSAIYKTKKQLLSKLKGL